MPEAAKAHTDAGAVAFAKYYFQRVDEIYQHPSAKAADELSMSLAVSSCKACKALSKEMLGMVDDDSRYTSEAIRVNQADRIIGSAGTVIKLNVTQFPAKRVTKSGKLVEQQRNLPSTDYLATLTWTSGGWRVQEIRL